MICLPGKVEKAGRVASQLECVPGDLERRELVQDKLLMRAAQPSFLIIVLKVGRSHCGFQDNNRIAGCAVRTNVYLTVILSIMLMALAGQILIHKPQPLQGP